MLIQFDGITRKFDDFLAVDGVSFNANQGEIIGLLGHNGAGKSTLIRMLTGYLEPTNGSISVDGLNINTHLHQIQSYIGYLPENCPLWPDMTIIEFLMYQGSLKGLHDSELEDHVYQVIKKTDLLDKATKSVDTLSKGYRQRVGVANAILGQPKIIILDEPTNGLDPAQTLNMRELIQDLAEHSTVILSTHILQEVQAMCDRVIVIRRGKLVVDALLDELNTVTGLRLCVDQPEDNVKALFSDFAAIKSITLQGVDNHKYQYMLDVDISLANKISQTIHTAGFGLFELAPERQNLETLFKQDYQRDSD